MCGFVGGKCKGKEIALAGHRERDFFPFLSQTSNVRWPGKEGKRKKVSLALRSG